MVPVSPLDVRATLLVCGFGFVLGIRHATDADHIVALSTIVSRGRSVKQAALIGSSWGLGHTVTIFLVGSLMILLGVHIPPRLGLGMEFCVAVMLVLLGLSNLTGLAPHLQARLRGVLPFRSRTPVSTGHTHLPWVRVGSDNGRAYSRSFLIGLVHGMAGSAAVALMVLATIRQPVWAILYLLIFGVGTIAGMVLMTTAFAVPLSYSGNRFGRLNAHLGELSGVLSLCFGLFLMYEIGFVQNLFGHQPHWIPS